MQFFTITLPLIRGVVAISAVFLVIGGLNAFEMVWLLTSQDPSASVSTLGTLLVTTMFKDLDIGRAAALAVILFSLVLAGSAAVLRAMKEKPWNPDARGTLQEVSVSEGRRCCGAAGLFGVARVPDAVGRVFVAQGRRRHIPGHLCAAIIRALQTGNYTRAWTEAHFGDYFANSVMVTATSVVLIVALGSMAAYALARFHHPAGKLVFGLIVAGLTIPAQLAVVPLFFELRAVACSIQRRG